MLEVLCVFCGGEIPASEPEYRAIRGFEKLRTDGGANQIFLREITRDEHGNELRAHERCIRQRIEGTVDQEVLPV